MKKRTNTKKVLLLFMLLFIIIIAIDVIFMADNVYEGHFIKLDTKISIKGKGFDMDFASRDILKEIDKIDNELSAHNIKSTLYKLNTEKTAEFSFEAVELINLAEDVRKQSENAFNIKIKPVIDLWGFGTEFPQKPEDHKLLESLQTVNETEISTEGNTVILNKGKIDLGGIAKGYAADKAKEILESYKEIDYAVIDFGGNILTYGKKPDGSKFKIGISNGNDGIFATISIDNAFIITSGGYERYFEQDSKKYHHIIDPKSGYPSKSGLNSVTIISDNGALADALSTACYVLGVEKGTELANYYGVNAVFLDENNKVYVLGDVDIELASKEYTFVK